jgi:hypothetical protein
MIMQTQTQTAAAVVARVAFVPAAVTAEAGKRAIDALAKAALSNTSALSRAEEAFERAKMKADVDVLASTIAAAALIGVPLTEEQWKRQFAKAIEAKLAKKMAAASVPGALSRIKVTVLAYLAGEGDDATHFGKPLMGEKSLAYLERVRPQLGEAKLPDGQWLITRNPDGTPKAKAGAAAGKAKAAPKVTPTGATSAATVRDDESGKDVPPAKAAAEARENAATVLFRARAADALRVLDACPADFAAFLDAQLAKLAAKKAA